MIVLSQVQCDQKTRDILGEDGIAEVTSNLWARDCQTCGQPLGSQPPALCIDDARQYATASLHHQRCRLACWNDGSVIYATGGAHLSWTSLSFMVPSRTGRRADPRPAVLVNPGLEMIFLEPLRGTWRPGYAAQFTSLGMVPPGPKLRVHRPLPGLSAWLANDLVSVTVETPREMIYEATATREVAARARELRGVLLMVTHALDPADLYAAPDGAWERIWKLMQSGQVICGWAGTARRRPAETIQMN
jgi:hypothetical protein